MTFEPTYADRKLWKAISNEIASRLADGVATVYEDEDEASETQPAHRCHDHTLMGSVDAVDDSVHGVIDGSGS